ncbi:general secretion pathway protein GspB [Thalassotalea sp. ND16A]|uniref:general secretion pathway protein GspB n=1 Tax=Thalassotalea sp. ND16A TaxID=1535422 RepID=UPI00051A065F|nr:general secretion pathway protein GspB [Thalassotalea sp. ND16A]KGJ89283.1 hypothetical protein ND16A_2176 [Thalassotalea sp. ND16A]
MSYIIDALRKSNSTSTATADEANNSFAQQLSSAESNPKSRFRFYQPVSLLLFAMVFMFAGYILGGGAELIINAVQEQKITALPNDTKKENTNTEAEGLKPYYGMQSAAAQYFLIPDIYNQQLIAGKKQLAKDAQAKLLAQQNAQQQAKQQELNKQIQLAIAEQGLLVKNSANDTANNASNKNNQPTETEPVKLSLNKAALDGVSPELLHAFETAIDDSNSGTFTDTENNANDDAGSDIAPSLKKHGLVSDSGVKSLALMPMWLQKEVPILHFSLHMYSSELANSWVRLNDQDYYTGDATPGGLIIEEIQPQKVIMQYKGQRFSLPALSNW